ncbi:hypothetical protein SNE40_013287 [Patella caerulea]|uniref:CRAL-TRIO domain-containing protein n=1 Tax=Patella caerulea TaxID=87958 RepID=A0AAN8JLW3_PATCE
MDDYLLMTKESLARLDDYTKVHVVSGNKSCDLDSTVSALVYAYYLYTIDENKDVFYLPLMQIPRNKFRLRLETVHFLDKVGIQQELLSFYEDISLLDLHAKGKLILTLVDYHVLSPSLSDLESDVVKVIDHRPIEKQWPVSCQTIIEPVGSCCTLIADEILKNPDFPFDGIVNVLLYGTILIDTINMSPEVGKTTDKDRVVVHELEESLEDMGVERDALFDDINAAKFDMSDLTTMEILEKDVKLIESSNLTVAMSSVTMEMTDLFVRENLETELKEFAEICGAQVVVLMTLGKSDDVTSRQLALYSNNRIYRQQIADVLLAHNDPSLKLEVSDSPFEDIVSYNQGNVQASRKKVLPIIKGFLNGEQTPEDSSSQVQSAINSESSSSVIGAMADSGKGESDHEQHILSNETMSPEMTDIFDPFSPQSITAENADRDTNQSELFQDFDNIGSKNNHPSNDLLQTNDISNTSVLTDHINKETSGSNSNSILDVHETDNDLFGIEATVNESPLSANQVKSDNTNRFEPPEEEDNFELTEADMYNQGANCSMLGTESPMEFTSAPNSQPGSKVSSYPVTPPNSFLDAGFMGKHHDLPSFNNSEMVQIIKAKQASIGVSFSENNDTDEKTEPYAPANSYAGSSFDSYLKETNLPSFQNTDLVQKVREKRASLDISAASGSDNLDIDPFPFTPHNSYMDKSLDQFALSQLSSQDLSNRLENEQQDIEADQDLHSNFQDFGMDDIAPIASSSAARVFDLGSKQSTQSDLLNMGYSRSGSSDTESSRDIDSPEESSINPMALPPMNQNNPFLPEGQGYSQFDNSDISNNIPDPQTFGTESVNTEDLLSNLKSDTSDVPTEATSNVAASQLAQQMISYTDDFDLDPLKSSPPTLRGQSSLELLNGLMGSSTQGENVVANQLVGDIQTNSTTFGDMDNFLTDNSLGNNSTVLNNALLENTAGESVLASEISEEMTTNSNSTISTFDNFLLGNPSGENVIADQIAQNIATHLEDENKKVSLTENKDVFDPLSSSQSDKNVPNLQSQSSLELLTGLTENASFKNQHPTQDNMNNMLLESPTSENIVATSIAEEISTDSNRVLNQINNSIIDIPISETGVASQMREEMIEDTNTGVNYLNNSLLESSLDENVVASQMREEMAEDTSNGVGYLYNSLLESSQDENVVANQIEAEMSIDADKTTNNVNTLLSSAEENNIDVSHIAEEMAIDADVDTNSDSLLDGSFNKDPVATQVADKVLAANTMLEDLDSMLTSACSSGTSNMVTSDTFQPFTSGEEEFINNTPVFDPFSTIKSEENLVCPDDRIEFGPSNEQLKPVTSLSFNPFTSEPESERVDPFTNVQENMSVQQEKDFDPFSTITSDGQNLVSGFNDNFEDIAKGMSFENAGFESNFTSNEKPEADWSITNDDDLSTQPELLDKNYNNTVSDPTEPLNTNFIEYVPSLTPAGNVPQNLETEDQHNVAKSNAPPNIDTGILKESNHSILQSTQFQDNEKSVVHQPSIQSDLSTSFEYNEGNSESFSDVSSVDNKNTKDSSEQFQPETSLIGANEARTSEHLEGLEEKEKDLTSLVQENTCTAKSELDKIKSRELVHQPSIQSDLSTSFEDKSSEAVSSNAVSPEEENPTASLVSFEDASDNPHINLSETPLPVEENVTKSNVISNENEIRFKEPDTTTPSSIDKEFENMSYEVTASKSVGFAAFSNDDSSDSNMFVVDDKSEDEFEGKKNVGFSTFSIDEDFDNVKCVGFSTAKFYDNECDDMASPDEQVDPVLNEEILKTSSALVETAFREAIDIERAHIHEQSMKNEVEPLPSESESEELEGLNNSISNNIENSPNEDADTIDNEIEENISEAAVSEVAFSFANELIKEALDNYDEVMEPAINHDKEGESTPKRNPPLGVKNANNSLSLETDYLPGMDPLRGSLDIYSAADHSTTISTDAHREVAESVSFRKISGDESPSKQKELLDKLRKDAEENKHDEMLNEEGIDASSEYSQETSEHSSSDWKSNENSLIENIPTGFDSNETEISAVPPHVNITAPSSPEELDFEPTIEIKPSSENELMQNEMNANAIIQMSEQPIELSEPNPENQNDSEPKGESEVEEIMVKVSNTANESIFTGEIDDFSKETRTIDDNNKSAPTSEDHKTEAEEGCFSDLTDREKKEVYMTSAGRMSISVDIKDNIDSDAYDNTPTIDPRSDSEHRQDISEIIAADLTPVDLDKKITDKDISHKEEWQDDDLPPLLDGEEIRPPVEDICARDDSCRVEGAKLDRPSSLERPPDTPTKKKIVPDLDLFNDDGNDDDILDDIDDDGDEKEDLEWENDTPIQSSSSEPIAEYSAQEESEDVKRWKVVNVGDKEYRIDLTVIEPYKKVISHGGYYGEGLNAIIVFSGCHLPDKRRKDYQYVMDHLFIYVVHTLEELVAEDYMIVYFHGATPKKQSPSFGWLKKCYQMIDRRLKKNLKSLLLVHPTLWLRTVVIMTKPFISSKFSSKLRFVKTLQDLGAIIPMENLNVPDAVKIIEEKLKENPKYLEEEEKREKKLEKEAEKERKKKLKEDKKKKKK